MAIAVEKLEKIYKEKRGADVRALKGISFNLPDTGMVFILGKSGCGKSTLLNVLGGLDGFDGGDIKVDGKSIKDYKAGELDKYRNDYVGFVFQENNLLEKESVRRNVSLALDLQSEKDTDGKVDSALESVGLKDFAERKCNRLSGGQKQRVAIARALIKQPKLLLCDEPTGALDSETGEDIFNLLKELSSERLVLVVSHDRESAEKYGDRIIEIKDGAIISDSRPQNEVDVSEQTKTKHGGLRFIRAFTMGVGYIIARPVRMAICLLICLITFTCVGVADTVNAYDRDKAMLYTMDELDSKCYAFSKAFRTSENRYVFGTQGLYLTEAEEISTLLDVERCDYIYGMGFMSGWLKNVEGFSVEDVRMSYAKVEGFVETDATFSNDYGFSLLAGRLPENNAEVALPEFLFNFYKTYGYKNADGAVAVNSYDALIGKDITVGLISQKFTVTGIIDTHFIYKKQAEALFEGAPLKDEIEFCADMENIATDLIHNTVFVCNGYADYFFENFGDKVYEESAVMRVIAPYKGSDKQKLKNIRIYNTQYNGKPVSEDMQGRCYHLVNYCTTGICDAEETFTVIKTYSVYPVAALVIISVLFFIYYASGTISEKSREIGILRALGASRGDILKITAFENGTFACASIAISSAISAIIIAIMNNTFTKAYGLGTTLIKFGIRQFAVVAAVAVLAVAVGVAFPLIKLLKKRPVDVIADRK